MATVHVYELAKEYQVPSGHVLSELKEMGEFVRSASSLVEPPVELRLRQRLANIPESQKARMRQRPEPVAKKMAPSRAVRARRVRRVPQDGLGLDRVAPRPYEWYRGEPIGPLAKHLLDNYVVTLRGEQDQAQLRPGKYFVREVVEANRLTSHWGWALMSGWTYSDIVRWVHTGLPVEQAVQIEAAGVGPQELEWHWEDRDRDNLLWRLKLGAMSVEEVVLEAVERRKRAN